MPRTSLAILCVALSSGCGLKQPPAVIARQCGPVPTFADSRQPLSIVHVTPSGDDAAGDGSLARPFRTIAAALRIAQPGTAIYIHAGTYAGGVSFEGLRGSAGAPIWLMGAPGEPRPVIEGGGQGLHLVKPRYVIVSDLEIRDTADNGINVDDGDAVADEDAARFIVFQNLDVHETGRRPSGIADCLKLAGVNDVTIVHSRFADCGLNASSGAVGVGGVGVHRAVVSSNTFEANGFGGVQFKGGSSDIEISSNVFRNAGDRAVQMGGSTGMSSFRPPPHTTALNYEAARIYTIANAFVGGEAAAAFTGCVNCQFANNTVVDPSRWVIRILQETVTNDTFGFAPTSRGLIAGNIFYFKRSDLNSGEDINVGGNTDTQSFWMVDNLWYAHDAPEKSLPQLPSFRGGEGRSIVGTDPGFMDAAAHDFRLMPTSVARAAGATTTGTDAAGACYKTPPSLGAFELQD